MEKKLQMLTDQLQQQFGGLFINLTIPDMVTLEAPAGRLLELAYSLRDDPAFHFEQLIDLCGVDYLDYGRDEWRTVETTTSGFSRGVDRMGYHDNPHWNKPRYGVVYHLLSVKNNQRLRLKVLLEPEPLVPSVIDVWPSANWYEREAFDLFGIVFDGHPDLRRLLTDYGFKGYPFRKDFPLIGEVELRYDAELQRCIYEPVSIQPRVLTPKVIRDDNRYLKPEDMGYGRNS